MVHICSAKVQIQSLKSLEIVSFGGMILRIGVLRLCNNDDEKCNKNSTEKLSDV